MMRFVMLFFVLSLFLEAKVTINDDSSVYDNFSIQYLYDENSTLTITNIQEEDFVDKTNSRFTFGYIEGTTWFKLTIDNNSSNRDFILAFNEAIWENLDLYSKQNGIYVKEANGLAVPLNERKVQDVAPAFELFLEENSTNIFYIKGNSIASQIGGFTVYEKDRYCNPARITINDIYIIFAFTLLSIVILNTYSFILTKESTYIYYVLYTLSTIVFTSMHSGSYLMFGFHGWSEGLHTVGAVVLIFLLLFSDKILELKSKLPSIHKFFMFSIAIFIIFMLLIYNNIANASLYFNIYASLFFIVLFFAAIKIFLKGSISAKYYLIALVLYAPLMSLMIATFNSFLDYTEITRHIYLLGMFIEIIFFTLILTSKYRSIHLEKIKIQDELIYEKSKNAEILELEISKRTEELKFLAATDPMTELYNRRYFAEMAESILEIAKRDKSNISIIILDIDDFKEINDRYGHPVGDMAIISIADMLKNCNRKSDILSRWGGEEFVILLPGTDVNGAVSIAQKIRDIIETSTIELENKDLLKFTVSLGVSQVDLEKDLTIEAAISRADKALYEAKESGKNRVCVRDV